MFFITESQIRDAAFSLETQENNELLCDIMRLGEGAQKSLLIQALLEQLHGYYLQCNLAYTSDPRDQLTYERTYWVTKKYLDFLEGAIFTGWINSSAAEAIDIKNMYVNYTSYANMVLYKTCKLSNVTTSQNPFFSQVMER